ncbi:MAG: sigma-70 family RNA polymerase sigma factor [Streptosporangiales bacterium]|nr:sigma-70 family RNA polymerase sigma factor [Streptosporangiales bacterium]
MSTVIDIREQRNEHFVQEALPFREQLYGTALTLTRDSGDAEDLVQEAYTKAYASFHRYEPGTNARAWLYRILVNTFMSVYRYRQRRPQQAAVERVTDWHLAQAESHTSTGLKSAETQVLENLAHSPVGQALRELPDSYRTAVYLADVEGFSYKEIARFTGRPIGTVMSRLHRGRQQLRDMLERERAPRRESPPASPGTP